MFTPQVLLSAPRRSAGVPNAAGTHVLYTTSTYSFETHKKTTELRCLDVSTNESTLITDEDGISEPVWLSDDPALFAILRSGKASTTDVLVVNLNEGWESAYVAGHVAAPASSLKIKALDEGKYAVALAAKASPDGSLFNPEKATKTQSTGRLYKQLFVRHWDEYASKERNAIWYGTLSQGQEGRYGMSGLRNSLKGTGLESPIPPFGGADHFDVGSSGIIFVAKDPQLNPALNSKCNLYLIRLSSFDGDETPKPYEYHLPGFHGASASPVFSPDGQKAAFLSMKTGGYESDKNQIFVIPEVRKNHVVHMMSNKDGSGTWDRSPQSLCFSPDGETLYCTAEDEGYGRLFHLPSDYTRSSGPPQALSHSGYISDITVLKDNSIFVTGSTLVEYSFYGIISHSSTGTATTKWTHSSSKDGSSLGLKPSQVSSIWFPASDPSVNKEVHAWVTKPSNFSASKKYPLAMLIHGGPQGSWADSWSTRWNPAVFAEQGYIVVAPNPTGSTGYGQAFTDAIRRDWGGAPYQDIVNCFEHVSKHMPEVDVSRAVMLGASYGGYMANWIQGHDLGRKFAALVCHDGIFSTTGLLATEELYFPFYDLGGTPWSALPDAQRSDRKYDTPIRAAALAQETFGQSSMEAWKRNDPSRFLDQWQTPQLVIHSSKDYRLPISEGLAAFNVLQARGVESQFLTFPDENHWVLKPENSLLWHKVVLNWINRFVGLPAFAAEDDEEGGGVEFFGGERKAEKEVVDMVGMGKPET